MWKNPTKHKIKYSLVWTPEKIEILYDNYKVRSVKDKKILEEFNNSAGQYIVLNNAVQPEKWDCGTSEFIVSSLTLDTERLIW